MAFLLARHLNEEEQKEETMNHLSAKTQWIGEE